MSGFGGFGVSLSDIALIADFTSRVRSAFDEDTGARSQYQSLVQSLDSLEAVLIDLKDLSLSSANLPFDGRLAGQAQGSLSLITHFKENIKKYETRLGPNALQSRFKGPFRKIQWAIDAAKDLDNFRRALAPGLDATKLIVSIGNIRLASELTMDVKAQSAAIEAMASEQRVYVGSQIHGLSQQNHRMQASLSDIQDNIGSKAVAILSASQQANSNITDVYNMVSQMSLQINKLTEAQNLTTHSSNKSNSTALNSACTPPTSLVTCPSRTVIPPVSIGYLSSCLLRCQTSVLAAFLNLLSKLLPNRSALQALFSFCQSLPQHMSLLGGNSVVFEDALGASQRLPWEVCQHAKIFEAFLEVHFEGKPGLDMVMRKDYLMMKGRFGAAVINPKEWSDHVQPKSRLTMSVIVATNETECPKCQVKLEVSSCQDLLKCDRCKRHYQTITSRSKVKALVSELSDSEATKKEETLRTSFQKLADKVHGEEAAAPSKLSDPQRQRLEPFKHMHLYAPLPTIDSQLPEMSATADLASLLQYPPRSDSPRAIPTNPSDAGYYQRKDPERFFLRRPSFDMNWVSYEASIMTRRPRRMLIAKNIHHGPSRCLPLRTYNGLGTMKKGLDPQTHAIIHLSTKLPYRRENETGMTMEPLAVIPAGPNVTLDKMTRVNFGRFYCLEHYIKVEEVGMLDGPSIANMRIYFPAL